MSRRAEAPRYDESYAPPSEAWQNSGAVEAALRFRILLWIVLAGWIVVILALGTSYFSLARTAPIIDPIIRWFAPSTAPETEYDWNVLVRWSAHFGEYAILFAALAIGPMRRRPLGALALCIACATLDEGLQWLRPARSGMIWDVALDTSGAAATMLLALPRWLSMRG